MNAAWVKSSHSFSNGNCVEVAELPGGSVGVRNSRDPDGPVLKFTQEEWDAFLGGARLGEFDRLRAGRLSVGHAAHGDFPWEPPLAGTEAEHLVGEDLPPGWHP
jgi:hypothetical protein